MIEVLAKRWCLRPLGLMPTIGPTMRRIKTVFQAATGSQYADDPASTSPIYAWTLALVTGLALLYGAYEYRADLANRIYGFRRYVAARRSGGV